MQQFIMIHLLCFFLFLIGIGVVLLRKNLIVMLMGVELMLNSVNISLVLFSKEHALLTGQVTTLFMIVVAATESAVGLALFIQLYRHFGKLDREVYINLKG